MTNRELLNPPSSLLGETDRQRLFVLRREGAAMTCPACKKPANVFEAAGIDIDQYDFGKTAYHFRCPHCGAVLELGVPAFWPGSPWHWRLQEDWLPEQLARAKAHDRSGTEE